MDSNQNQNDATERASTAKFCYVASKGEKEILANQITHLNKRKQILIKQMDKINEKLYLWDIAFKSKDIELKMVNEMLRVANKNIAT